jgi:hypothetical protein
MNIHFFDRTYHPVVSSSKQGFENAVEDYFYLDTISEKLGHHCYKVKNGNSLIKSSETTTFVRVILTIIKIISYFTFFIPLIMIIGKSVYRHSHTFKPFEGKHLRKMSSQKELLLDQCISQVRQIRDHADFIPKLKRFASLETPAEFLLRNIPAPILKKRSRGFLSSSINQMQNKVLTHGKLLPAHGVEKAKGGLKTLLNIILEGVILSRWWGPLGDKEIGNDPSIFSGPHGPFYIILDSTQINQDNTNIRLKHRMIDSDFHVAYLVPKQENKDQLVKALSKAVVLKIINKSEEELALKKIITYDDFLKFPKSTMTTIKLFKASMNFGIKR